MEELIKKLKDMKKGIAKNWSSKAEPIESDEEARLSGQIQGLNTAIEIIKSSQIIQTED